MELAKQDQIWVGPLKRKNQTIPSIEVLSQYVDAVTKRVQDLYERSASTEGADKKSDLLPIAFKELGTSAEELLVAVEQLLLQQDELTVCYDQIERERRRYQNLFEKAPEAYLVTDGTGTIQEANRAAAKLFNCQEQVLIGKPLSAFVSLEERRTFRDTLKQHQKQNEAATFSVRLHSPFAEPFDAEIFVSCDLDRSGEVISMRLCVRESDRCLPKRSEKGIAEYDLTGERSRHIFSKGDIIPLPLHSIWLVCEGWVKLSTLTEKNEEVFMGFVGARSPFGSSLTFLPIYQAIAVSDRVELVSLPTDEIAASMTLTQFIYERVAERLRQSESLLAVCGRRRVIERLVYLLQVLKEILGEPVANGTRLSVRLTHQELADACCTTRVTITRLLKELQNQGKIKIDPDYHIILPA